MGEVLSQTRDFIVCSGVGRKRRLLGLGRNAARMVVGLQHPEEAPTLNGFAEDSMCRKCVAWGRIIVPCPLMARCSRRCKVEDSGPSVPTQVLQTLERPNSSPCCTCVSYCQQSLGAVYPDSRYHNQRLKNYQREFHAGSEKIQYCPCQKCVKTLTQQLETILQRKFYF